MGGALLILVAAVVFFSTPWLGEAAPHYLPMPGIQLELNTTPSHFMHTLSVTAHNVDDSQTQFCAPIRSWNTMTTASGINYRTSFP